MAPISYLDHLTNPLVTAEQLCRLQDVAAGYWGENGQSLRYAQAQLVQAAGVLLRLPQEVIAIAIVILQRFWIAGNAELDEVTSIKNTSAAAIFLVAKLSFTPVSPRSVCNVFAYLLSTASPLWFLNNRKTSVGADSQSYYVSEGLYEREKQTIFTCESVILSSIGFDTHVALPHVLALTYLQALGVSSPILARRVLEHLNGALLSPQLLYLTHQPNALAVAAIYLAAREIGVKLVDGNWWEVFDVDREDLGFLVLGYGSLQGFAEAEKIKWEGQAIPLELTAIE